MLWLSSTVSWKNRGNQISFNQISISVIDAYGFIPKGIMRGNTNGLGFYDECLDVQQEIEGDTIKGRYCYAGLIVPLPNITAMTSHKRLQVNNYY